MATQSYVDCDYGTLSSQRYDAGCSMLKSDSDSDEFVVVGGITNGANGNNPYSRDIEICSTFYSDSDSKDDDSSNENNQGNESDENRNSSSNDDDDESEHKCRKSKLKLPIGLKEPRITRIDDCRILIMGGRYYDQDMSFFFASNNIYIADLCEEKIVYNDTLPTNNGLTEFSVMTMNGLLCIYGGVNSFGKTQKKMYCTPFGDTLAPTMTPFYVAPTAIPTLYPTTPAPIQTTSPPSKIPSAFPTTIPSSSPTSMPTVVPSVAPRGVVELTTDWVEEHAFTNGVSSQACVTSGSNNGDDSSSSENDEYSDTDLFIFGGILADQSVTNSFIKYNKNTFEETKYSINEMHYWGMDSMPGFYCKHQCDGM